MLSAVLLIALKTGWSETDILALPRSRFVFYLEKLTQQSDEQ